MKDRIRQFIDDRKLTATQFADEIGVQRSSISHILSGRNHPGYEFIQKMLKKYPVVNAEWLILGKGNMYKEATEQSLFTNVNNTPDPPRIEDSQAGHAVKSEDPPVYGHDETGIQDNVTPTSENTQKNIERVVIFYTDYTFDEYYPNKK